MAHLMLSNNYTHPITTYTTIIQNPVYAEVYSIQHYVIKFVSDLRQVGWISLGTRPVTSTNKTDRHDITEILLKVVLKQQSLDHDIDLHYLVYMWNIYLLVCSHTCHRCLPSVLADIVCSLATENYYHRSYGPSQW